MQILFTALHRAYKPHNLISQIVILMDKVTLEVFVAIRYAKACDEKSSRQRVSFRRHHFKSGKGILQKKQQRTANALSVKDLEKLNEEELKLLPLKDFWDAAKKEWKKNVFGTFAKRNSVTMKKIFGLA